MRRLKPAATELSFYIINRRRTNLLETNNKCVGPCSARAALEPPSVLDNDSPTVVGAAVKVGGHLAITVEGGVEAAIRVVAGDRDVNTSITRHDDLTVGLNGDSLTAIGVTAEVGDHNAVTFETGVKAANEIVAGHCE